MVLMWDASGYTLYDYLYPNMFKTQVYSEDHGKYHWFEIGLSIYSGTADYTLNAIQLTGE